MPLREGPSRVLFRGREGLASRPLSEQRDCPRFRVALYGGRGNLYMLGAAHRLSVFPSAGACIIWRKIEMDGSGHAIWGNSYI